MGFSIMGKKGGYERDDYGLLNPEQKTMFKSTAPLVTTRATQGTPLYSGEYTADYTPLEQENLNRQNVLANKLAGEADYYRPGYINPEIDANEWRNLNQKFYGNGINPGAKALAEEQYAGPSGVGYWSTPRANAVLNEYNAGVVDPYRNWRSDALQNSFQNALNYGTTGTAVNKATEELAQVPRLIKQYGLDQQYNEWVRKQNMDEQAIQDTLGFLNLSTVKTTYKPGEKGLIGDLGALAGAAIGTMIAPGVGTMMGAQLGGGLGGMFDESGSGLGGMTGALTSVGGMMGSGGSSPLSSFFHPSMVTGGVGGSAPSTPLYQQYVAGNPVGNTWSPNARQLAAMGYGKTPGIPYYNA